MHPLNILRRHWVELDGLWVPADSVNAFGHGHGHGLGSRAVWSPPMLVQPGDSWLLTDLDGAGGVTTAAQPDGPFPFDTDLGGWVGAGASLFDIDNTSPYAGVGCGRLTYNGDASPYAGRGLLTIGNRYIATGALAGDGICGISPRIRDAGGVTWFVATNDVAWQTFSAEQTATAEAVRFQLLGLSGPGYGRCDELQWRNLSISGLTCKGNLGNLVQATAANMPWSSDADAPTSVPVNGKRVVYADGVADHFNNPMAAMGGDPAEWTQFVVYKVAAVPSYKNLTMRGAPGPQTNCSLTLPSNTQVAFSGGGASDVNVNVGSSLGTHILGCAYNQNNRQVYFDSPTPVASVTNTHVFNITSNNFWLFRNGATAYLEGAVPFLFIIDRKLQPTEITKLIAYLKAYYAL